MKHHREVAYAVLRITVGVMFLFFGASKFLNGVGGFVDGLHERFAESPLPGFLVTVFATMLPFLEVILGTLLVLGLYTSAALAATGLLLVALAFGTVMEPDFAGVARNVNYALVVFVLLWLVDHNRYSLDERRTRGRAAGARGAGGV